MLILAVGADNLIRWDAMDLASNGVIVNDATTTFTLKDAAGATVATGSMPFVSNGRYDGILESTVTLNVGATYFLELTAVSGSANGFRHIECVAMYQDAD